MEKRGNTANLCGSAEEIGIEMRNHEMKDMSRMSRRKTRMGTRNKSKWQNMVLTYAKNKIWIHCVRTQVKMVKYGFELCPDTSRNGKIWI